MSASAGTRCMPGVTSFRINAFGLLTSKSQHKGSRAPSMRTAVVDEERMRPGYWLS